MTRLTIASLLLWLSFSVCEAGPAIEALEVALDPEVPTLRQVAGHEIGEQISSHAQIHAYFKNLAEAEPERIQLVEYAKSWQGRKLFYAIVGNREVMSRLDEIETQIGMVARGESSKSSILEDELPAVVWLSYSVHGNEISPSDAAIRTAYHLLAAEKSLIDGGDVLVIIDPLQNPDGRDRFIHAFREASGLIPQALRMAAEHDEPWPSGRVNHYLFDLNRDWLAITQPETVGKVRELQRWRPVIFVDAHEMGSDQTFFFAPPADPIAPGITRTQRAFLDLVGRSNARYFDDIGIEYFTRDIFDAFYPGYGETLPAYHGAAGMTYEQGSARGLVIRQRDGDLLDYATGVRNHFLASLGAIKAAAENRALFVRELIEYFQPPRNDEGPAAYFIPQQSDTGAVRKLVRLLDQHGLEIESVSVDTPLCGTASNSGYLVRRNQPLHRLADVLLATEVGLEEDFLVEQERRRATGIGHQMYDVIAWSLPLMSGVRSTTCDVLPTGLSKLDLGERERDFAADAVAFLAPGGDRASTRLLSSALHAGLAPRVADERFTLEGRDYPAGTVAFLAADHDATQLAALRKLAEKAEARIVSASSSYMTEGPSFGGRFFRPLVRPTVALAWDRPTLMYSAGSTRFVLEREFGYPVMPVRTARLAGEDLAAIDTLILPEQASWFGSYGAILGERGAANIKRWIEDGGVLVTLGNATAWAASPEVDLLATRMELATGTEEETDEKAPPARVAGTELDTESYVALLDREPSAPDSVPGVLVKAVNEGDHWLAAGQPDSMSVLVRGDEIYQPLAMADGRNVIRFADAEELLQSGYLWEENRRQLAFKPFVMVQRLGKGMIIAFTEDPTVRAYLDGLEPLLVHAALRGPTYSGKLR